MSYFRKINWKPSSEGRAIGLVCVLFFWGFLVVHYLLNLPKAKQRQDSIIKEIQLIPDPKSSTTVNLGSGFKTGNGYVKRLLRTALPPDQVEYYYREKLQEEGWSFMKKEMRLSRIQVIFCGSEESAVLDLPEVVTQKNYEFSLTMSWGIDYGCK